MKVDHIGIAVRDLEEASATFARILGMAESRRERVETEGVEIAVFETEGARIELLSPLHGLSPLAQFLEKRGPGIHHISLASGGLQEKASMLAALGFTIAGGIRPGGEGREVFFLHPKDTGGVLIEYTTPPAQRSDD
jgi:methylmalonyl-CoA epimerase